MKNVGRLRCWGLPAAPSSFGTLAGASALLALAAVSPAGAASESVIYNFNTQHSGDQLQAALIPGPDGVYYGTTDAGGTTGNGTVFELDPPADGQANWSQKVIHKFTGAPDGAIPSSGLLRGKNGVLYGVTGNGGNANAGVVFKLTPPGSDGGAWKETILYSFTGNSDGKGPFGALIEDANGVLYGATAGGGAVGNGVVFSLTPSDGGKAWTQTVIHTFQGNTDGASPAPGMVRDASGALYGMTAVGGANGAGTVYRLTPPTAGGAWHETILYSFPGYPGANFPNGGLALDGNGVLYGTTFSGGTGGAGTVFSLSPPSSSQGAWTADVLYNFTGGSDGGAPDDTPVIGADGTVYGTANTGGAGSYGTVYALTPPAKGQTAWTETTLVSFDGTNGANPIGLHLNAGGALIGTTYDGGTQTAGGGTVFKLTPPAAGATGWGFKTLHRFPDSGIDAMFPSGALLRKANDTLFGSSTSGGSNGKGAVFKLIPPANGEKAWHEAVIHSFDGADGNYATGSLVEGKNGALYGVTVSGGPLSGPNSSGGYGVVYALTPPAAGESGWTVKVLHGFSGVQTGDGAYPQAGLIVDASGALYGTTANGGSPTSDNTSGNGIVFKLTPPAKGQGSWTESIIHRFTGADGSNPLGTLLLGKSGELYGTTVVGGAFGEGSVFRLTPPKSAGGAWTESVLHSFDDTTGNDGADPGPEQLIADASGALYGTTGQGGTFGAGTVFKLTPPSGTGKAWTETFLHNFSGTEGAVPNVGLLASGGALYGVAISGGAYGYGTVFKLTAPTSGTSWKTSVLHSFNLIYNRGGVSPNGALIQAPNGTLYGITGSGGPSGSGVAFEVAP